MLFNGEDDSFLFEENRKENIVQITQKNLTKKGVILIAGEGKWIVNTLNFLQTHNFPQK